MPVEVQAFLEGVSVWTVIAWGAFFLLVIGVGIKAYPWLKKFMDFMDDVAGEKARPGVPARPGLMERMSSFEDTQNGMVAKLDTVHHELFPNSGKSLRDQTNRMEQKLDSDNDRIGELSDRLDEHITQSTEIISKLTKENP